MTAWCVVNIDNDDTINALLGSRSLAFTTLWTRNALVKVLCADKCATKRCNQGRLFPSILLYYHYSIAWNVFWGPMMALSRINDKWEFTITVLLICICVCQSEDQIRVLFLARRDNRPISNPIRSVWYCNYSMNAYMLTIVRSILLFEAIVISQETIKIW